MNITETFADVTLNTRGNVYFDGKCISHSFKLADGTAKSAGVILPSKLTFNTGAPEAMEGVGGECRVRLKGETEWKRYVAGETFHAPAYSSFDIEVSGEPYHYICHYQ